MNNTMRSMATANSEATPAQSEMPPGHGFGQSHPCESRKLRYVSAEDRQELIARFAYKCAERRGFAPGGEMEDWLAAEAQVGAGLDDQ